MPDAPDTIDTNDEYVITTLLNDPSLNTFFTLDNFNHGKWTKDSLKETIRKILANGTDETNPLTRITLTPMPIITFPPGYNTIPFLPGENVQGTDIIKNTMNIFSKDAATGKDISFNFPLNGNGGTELGSDGYIGMSLQNTFLNPGSDISFQYVLPKFDGKTTISYIDNQKITTNDGDIKCVFKNGCTERHFYNPNCQTVFVNDGTDNGTQCACNCSSIIKFNETGEVHSHCRTEDFSNSIINSLNHIQSINIDIPIPTNITEPPHDKNMITYDPNIQYLINIIADYYILLLKNKKEQKLKDKTKITTEIKKDGKHQTYLDSNELYKGEYLKIINISVGIFTSSMILYSILQN